MTHDLGNPKLILTDLRGCKYMRDPLSSYQKSWCVIIQVAELIADISPVKTIKYAPRPQDAIILCSDDSMRNWQVRKLHSQIWYAKAGIALSVQCQISSHPSTDAPGGATK
jgi:hypothetical protein